MPRHPIRLGLGLVLPLLLVGCGRHPPAERAGADAYRTVAADLLTRVPAGRAARLSPIALAPEAPPLDAAALEASGVPVYDEEEGTGAVALLSLSPLAWTSGEVAEVTGSISFPYPEADERGGHTFSWSYRLACGAAGCRIAEVRERGHDSGTSSAPDFAPPAARE